MRGRRWTEERNGGGLGVEGTKAMPDLGGWRDVSCERAHREIIGLAAAAAAASWLGGAGLVGQLGAGHAAAAGRSVAYAEECARKKVVGGVHVLGRGMCSARLPLSLLPTGDNGMASTAAVEEGESGGPSLIAIVSWRPGVWMVGKRSVRRLPHAVFNAPPNPQTAEYPTLVQETVERGRRWARRRGECQDFGNGGRMQMPWKYRRPCQPRLVESVSVSASSPPLRQPPLLQGTRCNVLLPLAFSTPFCLASSGPPPHGKPSRPWRVLCAWWRVSFSMALRLSPRPARLASPLSQPCWWD